MADLSNGSAAPMTSLSEAPLAAADKHLSHPKYRPDIDGLRAIAVLSVVTFHAFPSLIKGGFVGVDVFFVISGFLISSIIFGSLEKNSFSFVEFYSRRINRIFPALLLMLAATWTFGWFSLLADEYTQLGKHIAGGAAFVSNFVLWGESGYFDNSAETKLLLHLWSLGIEEQFYLIWPLLVWGAWKARLNSLVLTVIVGGVSFALNVMNVQTDPVGTFYSPQTRFWELLVGSLLAYVTLHKYRLFPSWRESSGPRVRNAQSVIGLTLLITAFALTTKSNQFPGWWALLPTLGTALIIAAGPFAWLNKNVLSHRLMVWFGLISFPLYLWHWPLLTFARIVSSEMPSVELRAGAVIASIGLAWLTFRMIEVPMRNVRPLVRTSILVAFMVIIGLMGYITFKSDGIVTRPAVENAQAVNAQFVATTGWKYAKNETCLYRYKFADADSLPWWFCSTNKNESPTTVIIGNSYANHLYPGIVHAAPDATVLSIGTCDPGHTINGDSPSNPCSLDRPKRQNDFIDEIIKHSGSVKTVVIDGLFLFKDERYTENLISRISYTEALGIKVVIFVPHLVLNYNPRACFSRPYRSPDRDCSVPLEERQRLLNEFSKLRTRVATRMSNVYFFDQNDTFCTDKACSMVIDGLPAYRDEYFHYSEYASDRVGKLFVEWATKNRIDLK
jgi:peptidoglycan/LPS O-acetylase OafA/YrhL